MATRVGDTADTNVDSYIHNDEADADAVAEAGTDANYRRPPLDSDAPALCAEVDGLRDIPNDFVVCCLSFVFCLLSFFVCVLCFVLSVLSFVFCRLYFYIYFF